MYIDCMFALSRSYFSQQHSTKLEQNTNYLWLLELHVFESYLVIIVMQLVLLSLDVGFCCVSYSRRTSRIPREVVSRLEGSKYYNRVMASKPKWVGNGCNRSHTKIIRIAAQSISIIISMYHIYCISTTIGFDSNY